MIGIIITMSLLVLLLCIIAFVAYTSDMSQYMHKWNNYQLKTVKFQIFSIRSNDEEPTYVIKAKLLFNRGYLSFSNYNIVGLVSRINTIDDYSGKKSKIETVLSMVLVKDFNAAKHFRNYDDALEYKIALEYAIEEYFKFNKNTTITKLY